MSTVPTAAPAANLSVSPDQTFFLEDGRDLPIFIHSALDDLPLSSGAFRVYGHLARRGGRGIAWPSYASIGEACFRADKITAQPATLRRLAIEAVKELCWFRLIVRVHRPDGDGGLKSNGYRLTDRSAWLLHQVPYNQAMRDNLVADPFNTTEVVVGGGALHQGGGALHQGGAYAPKDNPLKVLPCSLPAAGSDVVQALFDLAPAAPAGAQDYLPVEPPESAKRQVKRGRVTRPVVGFSATAYDPATGLVAAGEGRCVESVFHEFRPVEASKLPGAVKVSAIRVDDWTRMVGQDLERWRAVCRAVWERYETTRRWDIYADWFRQGIPDNHAGSEPQAKEAASGRQSNKASAGRGVKPAAGKRAGDDDLSVAERLAILELQRSRGVISGEQYAQQAALLQSRYTPGVGAAAAD